MLDGNRHSQRWFQIVYEYPGFRTGPTIPFLLGATREPIGEKPASPAAGQRELFLLLKAMNEEMPDGFGVRIQECPEIGELVAARCPSPSLTWDHRLEAHNVDTLAGRVWDRYRERIVDGTYSKNASWHRFTNAELKQIRKTLGLADEDRR